MTKYFDKKVPKNLKVQILVYKMADFCKKLCDL